MTDDEYIQQIIENTAGDKTLTQYYDISIKKGIKKNNEYVFKNVDNIAKDADSSGKLRFTITIPPEYRGHKNYYFVHVHNGEVTTIIDLDDNPDTITFEIDKFSTFALAYSDIEFKK